MTLAQHFAAYSEWRTQLSEKIESLRSWLAENELGDAQTDLRLMHLLEKLREDRLHVAFVAEFSRGTSELINAIFFADYGNRMLPSSAGRTTMCPTDLMLSTNVFRTNGKSSLWTSLRPTRCRRRYAMSAKSPA